MKKIKLLGFAVCALTLAGAVGCGSQSEVPDVPGGNTGDDTQTGFKESYGEVGTPINIWASDQECDVIRDVVDTYNKQQTSDANKFKVTLKEVSEAEAGTT